MKDAFIVSAARTPLGKFGGGLKDWSPSDLGAHAMRAAMERAGVAGGDLDGYIFGNVVSGGHGQHIARQAAFKAGIPDTIDGYHVNMVCSSGMLSVMNAATHIRAGEGHLYLSGGPRACRRPASCSATGPAGATSWSWGTTPTSATSWCSTG